MAYAGNTQKYSGNSNKGTSATQNKDRPSSMGTVFRTGLFTTEGGKSLASVLVKEAVTIPAGSYINLYKNEGEEGKPPFSITVRAAK